MDVEAANVLVDAGDLQADPFDRVHGLHPFRTRLHGRPVRGEGCRSAVQSKKDCQYPGAQAEQAEGDQREQRIADAGRLGIVKQDIAQSDPKVTEQGGEEKQESECDGGTCDPGSPLLVTSERMNGERRQ